MADEQNPQLTALCGRERMREHAAVILSGAKDLSLTESELING